MNIIEKIKTETGTNVYSCYQCAKCSSGCPVAYKMDYTPNQIIKMVHLGMDDAVLNSNTIWLCASCLTCSSRCPREIEIAEVMDVLRRIAFRRNIFPEQFKNIPIFNRVFLKNIENFGRLYEFALIGAFNLLSKNFFKDLSYAPRMFLKGKISIFPGRIRRLKKLRLAADAQEK